MIKRVAHSIYLLTLLLMLSACGGGGSVSRPDDGPDGGTPPVSTDPTVVLTISDQSGNANTDLTETSPLIVSALVTDSDGNPISGELVTFTFSVEELAVFDNNAGTALTNDEGIATIGLLVGSLSGSGLVIGTITVGDAATVTGSVGFSSSGSTVTPGATTVSLSINQQDGAPGNTVSEQTPLNVTALVRDENQQPVVDQLVTFSLSPENLAIFDNATGTALTGADGTATIGLLVGADSGSGLVTGSIATGEFGTVGFISEGTTAVVEVPADLGFFASQPQLSSSGSDVIQLQAIVKNSQNVLLEGIDVEFSANSGASIFNVQATTNALGTATADLSTLNNPENRIITAVASINGLPDLTQELNISVVGTSVSVIGPNSVIVFDNADLDVLLENSDNEGIRDQVISLTVTDEQGTDVTADVIQQSDLVTNTSGRASLTFEANAAGRFIIAASALNATTSFVINVQEDQFSFTDVPDINDINDDIAVVDYSDPDAGFEPITVTWLREGVPVVNQTVNLAMSRGQIEDASRTTDANGNVVFNIRSNNAGIASIVATGEGDGDVTVTARVEVSFTATEPDNIIVDATPDAIGPDGQTSTISAVVRDASGNRVGNQSVNFTLFDTSNGFLDPPQVTTDRSGIASTVYTSNSVSSNESVMVTASIGSIESSATLTVGDRPFDISLGTGRIIDSPFPSSYRKEFSVFVTDPDGNPVPNTQIFMSIVPLRATEGDTYFLGTWRFNDDAQLYEAINYHFDIDGNIIYTDVNDNGVFDEGDFATEFAPFGCTNEDVNFNGILDDGEDRNNDDNLTPGNVAAITEVLTTDDNGQAFAFVDYPRQFGNWVNMRVTARASSSGSESRESQVYRLGVALEDLNVEGSPPPSSPYGLGNDCSVTP